MALPLTKTQVVWSAKAASETKALGADFVRLPTKVIEVVTTGFSGTLDIQGAAGATATKDNVAYTQLGQDGAQLASNDQLSYTLSTARARYLVVEPYAAMQLVMTRSAGTITVTVVGWETAVSPPMQVKVTNPDGTNVGGTGGTASTDEADMTEGSSSGTPMEIGAESAMLRAAETAGKLHIVRGDLFRTPYWRVAFQDAVKKSIDDVLDVIGAENVKLFLPLWAQSGGTIRDLLRRYVTFTASGPTLGQSSPAGFCASFDGVNDYIQQDAITGATAGAGWQDMQASTAVCVQKLVTFGGRPGFGRFKIKKTGSPDGNLQVQIRTAKDGAAISNGTSGNLACSLVAASAVWRGFSFATAPSCAKGTTYYLAVLYSGNTNADGSNYISVQYDGAGGYGQGRNYYDGATWTDTAGEDCACDIYRADLAFGTDDWTAVQLLTNGASSPGYRQAVTARGMTVQSFIHLTHLDGYWYSSVNDGSDRGASWYTWPVSQFLVMATTFSYTDATAKIKLYANGALVASGDGTATTATQLQAQPLVIGANIGATGAIDSYWSGLIGPTIIAKGALTAANVGKVSHYLLPLRKLQEAV